MERKRQVPQVETRQGKSDRSREIQESEVAFGPYRDVIPGEKYNPNDLTQGGLPIRKYGTGKNEPGQS